MLLGVYLGLLVGVIPALVSWGLAFVFKYAIDITVPAFGVTVLAVALAGVNGGLLALADETITQNPDAPRLVTAILVVAMLSMYAHQKGDTMGAEFPRRFSLARLRPRTLSADLAEVVGGDEVRVRVVGEVADMEGYPPLPADLRAEVRAADLRLPADLPLDELERRVADRLEAEFDLADAAVTVDERGRATVSAAPPFSGLSKRVGEGRQAVSVACLVPTGLARGDEVTLLTPDTGVQGTVVSGKTDGTAPEQPAADDGGDEPAEPPAPTRAPTTDGGAGRLTVAVPRSAVRDLLGADRVRVVVESRGTRREYEAVSLLRRAGQRFRRLTVGAGSPLAGRALGAAQLREQYGTAVLAVGTPEGWQFAPGGSTTLAAGNELFVVGERAGLERFGAVAAGEGGGD